MMKRCSAEMRRSFWVFIWPRPAEVDLVANCDIEVMFSFMRLMSEMCVRPGAYRDPKPLLLVLLVLRCQKACMLEIA